MSGTGGRTPYGPHSEYTLMIFILLHHLGSVPWSLDVGTSWKGKAVNESTTQSRPNAERARDQSRERESSLWSSPWRFFSPIVQIVVLVIDILKIFEASFWCIDIIILKVPKERFGIVLDCCARGVQKTSKSWCFKTSYNSWFKTIETSNLVLAPAFKRSGVLVLPWFSLICGLPMLYLLGNKGMGSKCVEG